MNACIRGLGKIGEKEPAVGSGTAEREAEEERQEQYTDRIVPVEELEAPAFAGEFLRVGPRSPAEHGDNAENHGPGITVQNEHLWLLCNFPDDTTIRSSFYGFPPRRLHSASNSARAGKDFCVPTRVVESAA